MTAITVKWMRRGGLHITHAIDEQHLAQAVEREWETVYPLAVTCGPFPTTDLIEDERASRCVACKRALAQLERQQP